MFYNAGNNATTWSVTIPAKTGEQANETTKWYIGDGKDNTKYIEPASGKTFTLPAPASKTIANILPSGFPTSFDTGWKNQANENAKLYVSGGNLLAKISQEKQIPVNTSRTLTPEGDNYSYSFNGCKWTFIMSNGKFASVIISDSRMPGLDGTYQPPVSPQLLNAPLAGSEEAPAVKPASIGTKSEGTGEDAEAEKDYSVPVEKLETEIPEAAVPEIAEEVKPEEVL